MTVPFGVAEHDRPLLDRVGELTHGFAADAAGYDDRAEIAVGNLDALHAAGTSDAVLPAALGGSGIGYQAFGELVRIVAKADPSTATILTMHSGAGVGLAAMTSEGLGTFYADEFLAGKRFANALSEPTSGNRFLNPQQEAEPGEHGWVLDGAKRFVSGSEIADHLLVNALVDGEPVFFGVVPDETVTVIPIWDTLGLRATRSQLLSFSRTPLRRELRGRAPAPGDFAAVPAGLPAISLGIAAAALDALVEHARSRQILGRPLSRQQWVQHAVADAETHLAAVEAFFERALWRADSGDAGFFADLSGRSTWLTRSPSRSRSWVCGSAEPQASYGPRRSSATCGTRRPDS